MCLLSAGVDRDLQLAGPLSRETHLEWLFHLNDFKLRTSMHKDSGLPKDTWKHMGSKYRTRFPLLDDHFTRRRHNFNAQRLLEAGAPRVPPSYAIKGDKSKPMLQFFMERYVIKPLDPKLSSVDCWKLTLKKPLR